MKRNYKSIATLAKVTEQLTLQNIISQRAYHKKAGWIKINDLMTYEVAQEIADLLGGRTKTKDTVRRVLLRYSTSLRHWGLDRIIYDGKHKRFQYIAGQSYPDEIREIRNYIKAY